MPLVKKPADNTAATGDRNLVDGRWTAARALAEEKNVPALAQALASETDARVRAAILTGLAQIATFESADAVLPYLRADDAAIRTGALDALRAMPEAVRPRLKALLNDPDVDIRILSCEIVRSLPGTDAEQILCERLAIETESNVCGAAIDVLAEIGTPEALPAIASCAQRFKNDQFLEFAIGLAMDRLRARSDP